MYQNGKIVAWRLIAFLLVLSISISLLAMSPMLALADTTVNPLVIPIGTHNRVLLGIWRPSGSTIGSVRIKLLNSGKVDQCVNLGQQNVIYGFGNVDGNDTVTIRNFPGTDCVANDGVNRDPQKDYTGPVNSLAPGSTDGKYRVYMTPKEA